MDIRTEKLELIEWLTGVNDLGVIVQLKELQISNEKLVKKKIEASETLAEAFGDKSPEGTSFKKSIREKYPNLFK